jgi:hypothetical protein
MKSQTIHVGMRSVESGAEQEDEEDGRLSASMMSLQSCGPGFSFHSGPYRHFFISASNKVLYRYLHDVRDAASTPGLMSFDPGSVDAVARNFYPLCRCPASYLGAVAMLYPDKQEKCN